MTEIIGQSHDILGELRDCGVLSKTAHDTINDEVDRFFKHLRDIASLPAEDYWTEFRQCFGFAREPEPEQYIPINAANLCPEPTPLLNAINLLRAEYNENVAQQTRMGDACRVRQLEATRKALAVGLGLRPEEPEEPCFYNRLAIVRNASEGNNAISCGYRKWKVPPKERDNVVLWKENHPTNLAAWALRAGGEPEEPELFEIKVVGFELDASDNEILRAFTSVIDDKTRFVSYSETSNGSGFRIPKTVSQGIWDHVSDLDCHIHIDGTMEWGAAPIDQKYCHSFVSSGHKWFLGPKQTGVLCMSKSKVANFEPSIFAYDYKIEIPDNPRDFPELALRFEMLGQRDDVDIIALIWTQGMWCELIKNGDPSPHRDPYNPYMRVTALATHLKSKLQEEWALITPVDETRSRGVVRVKAPRDPKKMPMSLYDYMYEKHRIAGSVSGSEPEDETFRLCPHIYNNLKDIDRAIDGMNEWLRAQQ